MSVDTACRQQQEAVPRQGPDPATFTPGGCHRCIRQQNSRACGWHLSTRRPPGEGAALSEGRQRRVGVPQRLRELAVEHAGAFDVGGSDAGLGDRQPSNTEPLTKTLSTADLLVVLDRYCWSEAFRWLASSVRERTESLR
jgi:hypothetical protein